MTVAFADLFRRTVDGATGATPYLLAAAYAILSALCVLAHEIGHVLAALSLGLRVRRVSVYNARPGLPLDGGRVLRATVWGVSRSRVRGTIVAAWGGRVVALAVAASGLLVSDGDWRVAPV